MLSKDVFKNGLKELKEVFDDFGLSKEKIEIWYKYSKDLDNEEFLEKIENCIKGCRKVPTLADILDQREYYSGEGEPNRAIIASARRCYSGCYGNCGASRGDGKESCEWCFANLRGR